MWSDHPAPTPSQREDLAALLAELDAGRVDAPAVRRWTETGAPYALLLRALALIAAGRYDEAAGDVASAVGAAPSSIVVRTAAARIRFVLRDYSEALTDLDVAAGLPAAPATARAAVFDSKFELARRLGSYGEAIDAVDAALACDANGGERRVRRLERLAQMLLRAGNHAAALDRLTAALADSQQSIGLYLRAAVLQCRVGDAGGARRSIAAATELSARVSREEAVRVRIAGARYLIDIGDLAAARAQLHAALDMMPGNGDALALVARLDLWAGNYAAVDRLAEQLMANGYAAGWRLAGALHVVRGGWAAALEYLDEAVRRDPHDAEAHVWLGEAFYRSGDHAAALAALNRGGEMSAEHADYLASQILRLLVLAARDEFPGLPEQCVPEALDRMFPGEREATDSDDVPALCALLERALVLLRGNRSVNATYVPEGAPAAELRSLRLMPSPRGPAKAALWVLVTEGVEHARRALQRVHADYARSPEPHCYHGEMYLYLGDYAAARRQFEQALALYGQTRWAFIGLGAVELLEGRPELTPPLLERSIALSRGAGPTLFVYRGEALRRLGRLDEAIADLAHATQLNPARVSAWINLGLARDAAGEATALDATLAHLRRFAPGLVHDAALAAGLPVSAAAQAGVAPEREVLRELYETMLQMMRGNRSSTCVTYFTADGHLRVVTSVPVIDAQSEAREMQAVRGMLLRATGLAAREVRA